MLTGPLTELGLPIPITIALPPPEDRAFADVWSALGGELKPSIDLVVIAPLDTGQRFQTGPPVSIPPTIDLGGSNGWPAREAKSGLNGYQTPASWQAGQGRLVLAGGGSGAGDADATDADDADAQDADSGGGRRRGRGSKSAAGESKTGGRGAAGTAKSGSGESGSGGSGSSGSGSGGSGGAAGAKAEGDGPGGASPWEVATSWADAMAPLGSAESGGPGPGQGEASAGTPAPPTKSAGAAATGSARKTTGGRPGPRVAMTRVRQTKKKS